MSNYKYTQQDKKDVIELLRGIANDLEDTQPAFSYDHIRMIAINMVQSILSDIDIDLNEHAGDFELSIDWNHKIEIDAGSIRLYDVEHEIVEALESVSDEEIQTYIDSLNEVD